MLGLLFGIMFVVIVSAVIVGSEAEKNLIDKEDKWVIKNYKASVSIVWVV